MIQLCVSQGWPFVLGSTVSYWDFICAPSVVLGIFFTEEFQVCVCVSVILAFGVLPAASQCLRAPFHGSSKHMLCIASSLQSWRALTLCLWLLSGLFHPHFFFLCYLFTSFTRMAQGPLVLLLSIRIILQMFKTVQSALPVFP